MNQETKKGLICLLIGLAGVWATIYIINREKKQESKDQPVVTDESIRIASEAYKTAMEENEPKQKLDEINRQLVKEYGLSVEFEPMKNKYIVRDLAGKKVKEV